jgi:phosphoheptose isomerase
MGKTTLWEQYISAMENVDPKKISAIARQLVDTVEAGGRIFTAGNGGSHSIAQHFASDLIKCVGDDRTNVPCEAYCLSDNVALLTAVANDVGYDEVFSAQARWRNLTEKDAIVAFSVSGVSTNLNNLQQVGYSRDVSSILVTGMKLDYLKDNYVKLIKEFWSLLAVSTGLDIKSPNHYYVCESVFSAIAHAIAHEFHVLRGRYYAQD